MHLSSSFLTKFALFSSILGITLIVEIVGIIVTKGDNLLFYTSKINSIKYFVIWASFLKPICPTSFLYSLSKFCISTSNSNTPSFLMEHCFKIKKKNKYEQKWTTQFTTLHASLDRIKFTRVYTLECRHNLTKMNSLNRVMNQDFAIKEANQKTN